MDFRFSETEMTADGKTISVFVDEVMSRVELFRAAEATGHGGWAIVDHIDGDREFVGDSMALSAAKKKAMEYLIELDDRGENLYFGEADDDSEDDRAEDEPAKPYVDGKGQHRLFGPGQGVPLDADYCDARHEKIVAQYERAKVDCEESDEIKKRATAIAKNDEAHHHYARIKKNIDDARIESMKQPGRGIVPILHLSKTYFINASDVHAYALSETKFYQAYRDGVPVTLDEAIEADRAARGAAGETAAAESDSETAEREYCCPIFERDTVTANGLEEAMTKMMCTPEDENSGCIGCYGPTVAGPEAAASLEPDLSDLPNFGDDDDDAEADPGFAQERAV